MIDRNLTLCQNLAELSQNGGELRIRSLVVRAGPQRQSAARGHLRAQLANYLPACGRTETVRAGPGIYVHRVDLGFFAQALDPSADALSEGGSSFVALLRDHYPIIGSEGVTRGPGGCRSS
ncbi:MAG TPA: hypothetical protein VER11_21275 [Polyangiaceae bacterium]|nr:hypothetical protein [Polyangiaceae bacterium]